MDFEEMQVIWDSQNDRKLFALDLEGLRASVRRRARRLGWSVNCDELGMVAICLFVAWSQASEPLLEGTDRYKYIGAALLLGVALYLLRGRFRRLEHERAFDSTLVGELNRAIYRIDYQIWRSKTFRWWFLLPSAVIVSISFTQTYATKPWWVWPIVVAAFFLGAWVTGLGLRCGHLPLKRELESLRVKLAANS